MTNNELETDDEVWLFKSYADEKDVEAVSKVIRRGTWWANGPEIDAFENKIAEVAGTKFAVAFNSGTSALYSNLLAHEVTGGEVIVPSFTFPATANAVVAAGAKPIFADIERKSLALAADSVRNLITDETKAVMPIHFEGDIAAEIEELRAIAQANDAVLLEDACHSLGASMNGTPVGSFGSGAAFSFCFNKILSTGEGGMVTTNSSEIRDQLLKIRSHGRSKDGTLVTYGNNFRMASMNAALGLSQIQKLDDMISERYRMAQYLNERLSGIDEIDIPLPPEDRNRVYLYYNLRLSDVSTQNKLAAFLDERGIPTRVTYEPVHLKQYYGTEWGYGQGDLPITEDVAGTILTIPFHLYLTDQDIDFISESIRSFFN